MYRDDRPWRWMVETLEELINARNLELYHEFLMKRKEEEDGQAKGQDDK